MRDKESLYLMELTAKIRLLEDHAEFGARAF
jgi:hypothetical protein